MLADIHLRPTLWTACKIVSSAIAHAHPELVTKDTSMDGAPQFKYNGFVIMPPYPKTNSWVEWVAKDYHHAWWMIEQAWWADKEMTHRFGTDQTLEYLRLSKLVEDGVTRLFPKPELKKVGNFPRPTGCIVTTDDVIAHRFHYRALKQKHRMKWTAREEPMFMLTQDEMAKRSQPEQSTMLCDECGAPKPATAGCGIHACPFSIN